jgi:hypothetical protein
MTYTPTHPVSLPLTVFTDLRFHLMMTRQGVEPDAFVTELVQHWLKLDEERLELHKNGPAMRGFQWKNVFLPEGTCLRTSYNHSVEFAKVVGDGIRADDGAALTPSLLANRHAKGRNAWRLIWLRFPGEEGWIRADDCRARPNGSKS